MIFALRFAYVANRKLGALLITLVGLGASYYMYLQYSAEQNYQRLLADLKPYRNATVRRELFPLPKTTQLSIGYGVTDTELSVILDLDGLDDISDLYLDNSELTDASLVTVASKLDLNYIFIDCDKITDAAIRDFSNRFPNCRVIPYKREFYGVDVYVAPLPSGD